MLFSIVIPVYNVADYLQKCVDSVLKNDCTDCEILLVDDGSTDGKSGALCDKLEQEHPDLIRVIHQENRGLGGARNTGIENAKGEYLFFVDSDDYIAPNSLTRLACEIEKTRSEVYSFQLMLDNGSGTTAKSMVSPVWDGQFTLHQRPEYLLSLPSAAARIWKRELFLRTGIRFPSKVWYEDIRTSTKLFAEAKSIVTLPDALYFYLSRPGSITRNTNLSRNREILDAFDDILAWFEGKELRTAYENELCRLAIDHVLMAATVRVARIDRISPLIGEFRAYMEEKFPAFRENPYLSQLPRSKKLVYRLIEKKHYGTLALLFRLRKG